MTKILGIDPGRSKTGLALLDEQGKIIKLHIAVTKNISNELQEFLLQETLSYVVIGDGTNSSVISNIVEEKLPQTPIYFVGEAHSTEEARLLYWCENPPHGWRKLIPLTMQVPPEPLDAYAAVVQVRRWLDLQKNNK